MNVFVIPSYYPSAEFPILGIFCKEQAIAIGAWRPQWNVIVSCWGQEAYHLFYKRPHEWPTRIFHYFKQRHKHIKNLLPNVFEFHTPILATKKALAWFLLKHSPAAGRSSPL
jgi:hypothetical protein